MTTTRTPQTITCPDEVQLLHFLQGSRNAEETDTIELHLDVCDDCRMLLATLVKHSWVASPIAWKAESEAAPSAPLVTPPRHLTFAPLLPDGCPFGRYRILSRLGMGGMGVVYLAHDPKLDRQIALKLMRPQADTAMHKARLEREAQAMARLSHPNIVTVYELGEFAEQLYIAMEFVEGQSLTRWLQTQAPSQDAIIARFVEAGEGLAFAHDKGVIHRDFKPDNVLLNAHHQAEVTDFGLAQTSEIQDPAPSTLREEPAQERYHTQTGTCLGTPAYMAPEQIRGEPADARSDQFSFCVSLWEALTGSSPYTSRDLQQRLREIESQQVSPAPSLSQALRATLLRGLSSDPGARYPSIRGLLQALKSCQKQPRPRRLWLAAALVVGLCCVILWKILAAPNNPGLSLPQANHNQIPNAASPRATTRHRLRVHQRTSDPGHTRQRSAQETLRSPNSPQTAQKEAASPSHNPQPPRRQTAAIVAHTHRDNRLPISQYHTRLLMALGRGQLVKAKQVFVQLEQTYQRESPKLARDHPAHLAYAKSLHNRGMLALFTGNAWEATHYLRESLKGQIQIFGKAHLALATTRWAMSLALASKGQHQRAAQTNLVALEGLRRVHGPKDYVYGQSLDGNAFILRQQGKLTWALQRQREAQTILAHAFTKEHIYATIATHNLGLLWTQRGDQKRARKALESAVTQSKATLPQGHWIQGVALYNLGRYLVLYARPIPPQASLYLRQSANIFRESIGMTRSHTRKGWSLLAAISPSRRPQALLGAWGAAKPKTLPARVKERLMRRVRALWIHQPLFLE